MILTDTHFVSVEDVEALVRDLENLAVVAALDPNAPSNVQLRP